MTGLSKPTISRAIRSGKISATPNGKGGYEIDPSELARVFPIRNPEAVSGNGTMKRSVTPDETAVKPGVTTDTDQRSAVLDEQITGLRAQLEMMRERLEDARGERDDARDQRDAWRGQAEAAQRLLADARPARGRWFGLRRA